MRHPDEGTIHAWLDGALDDADMAWIESHSRECPACGALVAEARGLVAGASRVLGALDGVPGGVLPRAREAREAQARASEPASTGEATVARVLRRAASRSRMEQRPRWTAPLRAAAALLLVAGGTAVVLRSTGAPYSASMARVRDTDVQEVLVLPGVVASAPESGTAMSSAMDSAVPAPTAQAAEDMSSRPMKPMSPTASGTVASSAAARVMGSMNRADASPAAFAEPAAPMERAALRDVAAAALDRRERQRAVSAPLRLRAAPDTLAVPVIETVVTGEVRDEHTGEPVAGASILLDDGDIGTITDQLGRFTIMGTTTGVHRAQVRRMGYAATEREVSVTGDSSVLNVRLTPSSASIAAALGEGYTPVATAPAPAKAAAENAKALAPTPSVPTMQGAPDVPLATRAPAPLRRSTQRDAAGRCLAIELRTIGTPGSAPAARTVTVRLLPTVSRDTALEGRFALEFPRAGDVADGARGSWMVAPRAGQDERNATEVRLHWTAAGEEVRVRLDWAHETPDGRASVRRGGVGVDARATATRVECVSIR